MARNRRRNSLQSTFKDYLVPIIWWVLILVLIYSFLWKDENSGQTDSNWDTISEISFLDSETEAFIIYPWEVKEKITDSVSLNVGDTIVVESWSVELTPTDGNKVNLNKIAEFKIDSDGSYNLYSSDAWVSTKVNTDISMSYANISAPANTTLSLTQNEAVSTVYVLSWDVKVSNLAGISTLVTKWQKVSIAQTNAAKEDLDLAADKTSIDSYFKWSDWFIANSWSTTLSAADVTLDQDSTITPSASWSLDENSWIQSWAKTLYLQFDTLKDEMTFTEWTLDITWRILSEDVSSITINNTQTTIGEDRKFSLSWVWLPNSINDIVVKVYDTTQNVIDKEIYTIYNSTDGSKSTIETSNSPSALQSGGTTYKSDATQFGFSAPSTSGKFSTTNPEVTIWWYTTAKWISRVQVNGFTLNSFNGKNWRYHAFERFTTLKEWSNQYKIDYYGADWKIAYTDYYTIVKKSDTPQVEPEVASTPLKQESETSEKDIPSEDSLFSE